MKRLIEQRYTLKQNILTIIGICLCLYFSYHLIFGTRSYLSYVMLERNTERLAATYDGLRAEREALESRVRKLRPGSLDRDMLEEQARIVLGYSYPEDRIILNGDMDAPL